MRSTKKSFCVEATLLLVASLAFVHGEEQVETSTVDYETGHGMALTAFETASPDHSHLLGDEGSPRIVANELLDIALEKVRELIISSKMDRVEIPEFTHDFKKDFGFFKIGGSFKGMEGWVESLLSIRRSADATLFVEGTSLVLDALLGLEKLDLGMKFEAELAGLKVRGNLKGHVASNSVFLSNAMDYATGKCELKIRKLKVENLGKIYVDVTGLGELDWLSSLIATWMTDRTHDTIKNAIDKVLYDVLKKELKKAECPNIA